jgi:hypothetical protein
MMLRRNAREALETQIANTSARKLLVLRNEVSGQLVFEGVKLLSL